MDRDSLRGKVQTVTGVIEPSALGKTLMHEHLLCDIRTPTMRQSNVKDPEITLANVFAINYGRIPHYTQYLMDLKDIAVAEMGNMKEVGGNSLVELSCGGLKPDPKGLQDISLATDVNVIMGCGHYVDEYQEPGNHRRTPEDFAREMISQIFDGAWGTDIRAGIIGEIGCQNPWTDLEKKVMQGAILAQQETGVTLNIHPGRHEDLPLEIATSVRDWGGDLSRTVISHIDRTIFDEERILRLAETGVIVEFDLFGTEQAYYRLNESIIRPNDGRRIQLIRSLIERGHLEQVLISHDICSRTRLTSFGGHGYGHIFVNVVPMMRGQGFTEEEIAMILEGNPRRLLTVI